MKKLIIDVVAPSSKTPGMYQYFDQIQALFKDYYNIQISIADNIIDDSSVFSASTLEVRLQSFISALQNPDSNVIWAYRGGYGSMELIPFLRPHMFNKYKVLVGFSDITALHLYFNQIIGWSSLHATVLDRIVRGVNAQDHIYIINALLGNTKNFTYDLYPINAIAKNLTNRESILGQILGGNLSMVQYSLGTNWQLNSTNKILIFEDVGERGYRIFARLEQLKQVGILEKSQAILFGEFTNGEEQDGRDLTQTAIQIAVENSQVPAFFIKDIGHIARNLPLPLGTSVVISQNKLLITNPFI
ncbi:LD-carboxypeptidase [Candidatus Tisiphia endosymbiont of Micropterix aruncella]|uniref:LD-carboxypeptidase n=1 Tax=Candidatus Tisiphia endosymbiont of Micropterix aruncella TaxID=3066271 RepID=UPI003AA870D8